MLKCVDTQWMDHIDAMDQLQKGIRLRAYAQRDPVVEYRLEGFDMFDQMIDNIRDDVTRFILSAKIQKVTTAEEFNKMINQEANQQARKLGMKKPIPPRPKADPVSKPVLTLVDENDAPAEPSAPKVGRNDPCPCGSGKKYKRCCGQNEHIGPVD